MDQGFVCSEDKLKRFRGMTALDLKEHFGAIGDGKVDDSDSVQCALRAQTLVYVPPGVYRLTRAMQMYSGSRLRGTNIINIAKNAPVTNAEANPTNASIFQYRPAKRVELSRGMDPAAQREAFANTVFICTD